MFKRFSYEKVDDAVSSVERFIIIVAYATLLAIIGFETLRRIFFHSNWLAGPEVAMYAFVWLTWFAMAHNIHNDTHLSFTEFRNRLKPKVRRLFELFDCMLWIVAGIIVISTSWVLIERQWAFYQTIIGTNIPVAIGTLAVPMGWAFSMFRIVQRMYRILYRHEDIHVTPVAHGEVS